MSTVSTARSRKRAQDDWDKIVISVDAHSPIAGSGSQPEALILRGTQASPIDVEALDSERNKRTRKLPAGLVDLEAEKTQEGCVDAGYTLAHCNGSIRRSVPPVICLSPHREGGASCQAGSILQVSRVHTKVAPKEPVFTCSVCLNKLDNPSSTTCGHIFCEKCIKASIKAQKKCPTCRKKLGARSYHRVYLPTTAE